MSDVAMHRAFAERPFGMGDLLIEVAGGALVTLTDLPHVDRHRRLIYKLIEDDRKRRPEGVGPVAAADSFSDGTRR